jgi:cytochrome P450
MTTAAARPPGPKGTFLLGNLSGFNRDPLGFLTRCARAYGDVVYLRTFNLPVYLVSHPDQIEEVLVTQNRNFIKDKGLRLRPGRRLFGNGLLTSEGEFWIRQRRLAQPAFHRERIAAYGEVMVAYTERMLDEWRAGEARDFHQDMMRLTLEIVAKTLFDAEAADEADEVSQALEAVQEQFSAQGSLSQLLGNFLPTPSYLRFQKAVKRLDEIIYRIIEQHRGQQTGDLLSLLLEAQDEDGSQMTDRQLRDEAITLFLAGHETTALALSWTCYLLGQHPAAEEQLVAELEEVLGDRAPGVADLPRLRYTEMIVKEARRLYPPAWGIGREALESCAIGGYRVPAGAQVMMCQWIVHRDPRYFDEPEAFRPERWADDLAKRLPKYAYFPFGGGPRLCIGNSLATMEATLILATIAQQFQLTLLPEHPVTLLPSITLRPKEGVKVRLAERQREIRGQETKKDSRQDAKNRQARRRCS